MQRLIDDIVRLTFSQHISVVADVKVSVDLFCRTDNRVSHNWVCGISLREILDNPSLRNQLRHEFAEVLRAVSRIHNHNPTILHGDISPGNLIRSYGESNRVHYRLIDWSEYSIEGYEKYLKRRKRFRAKPSYLSPRRANSGVNTVDDEIYALGSILFEWVTGQPLLGHEAASLALLSSSSFLKRKIAIAPTWVHDLLRRSLFMEETDSFHSVSEFLDSFESTFDD